MPKREVRFLSWNEFKIKEAQNILGRAGVTVKPISMKIHELQTDDEEKLVKDKALKAFDIVRVPVFVEHTGLYLAHLGGLPGGLTQIFWDTLQADRFAELFGTTADPGAIARTMVGYIDGRRFHHFSGEVHGKIVSPPRGSREFQWDCVFQPLDRRETFAEMGMKEKNTISMRRRALDRFAEFLEGKSD